MGFEPTISVLTGRRALRTAPRGQATGGTRRTLRLNRCPTRFTPVSDGVPGGRRQPADPCDPGCQPVVVAADPTGSATTHFARVDSPGVAPGSPTCHAGVFLLDDEPVCQPCRRPSVPDWTCQSAPGGRRHTAEAVGLEPTTESPPYPLSRQIGRAHV